MKVIGNAGNDKKKEGTADIERQFGSRTTGRIQRNEVIHEAKLKNEIRYNI